MNKYVNEGCFKSTKFVSFTMLLIGILGFMFWGFAFFATLMYGGAEILFITFLIGIFTALHVLLIYRGILKKKLDDMVYMYARYFEGDLDGYVYISDMVNAFSKNEQIIYNELSIFIRRGILTNVSIRDYNGKKQVVLQSTTEKCQCKNCGAIIDKRVYFTGVCPYCQSSDIYAGVINKTDK